MGNQFFYTDQVLDWFKDFLTDPAQAGLGLKYVAWGRTGDIIKEYPAVLLANAPRERQMEATHQFLVTFNIDIYVLHSNLMVGHEQRTREDIQLVNAIQDLLDENMTLPTMDNEDNIVGGYIIGERPGILSRQGSPVVGTLMQWFGTSRQHFP